MLTRALAHLSRSAASGACLAAVRRNDWAVNVRDRDSMIWRMQFSLDVASQRRHRQRNPSTSSSSSRISAGLVNDSDFEYWPSLGKRPEANASLDAVRGAVPGDRKQIATEATDVARPRAGDMATATMERSRPVRFVLGHSRGPSIDLDLQPVAGMSGGGTPPESPTRYTLWRGLDLQGPYSLQVPAPACSGASLHSGMLMSCRGHSRQGSLTLQSSGGHSRQSSLTLQVPLSHFGGGPTSLTTTIVTSTTSTTAVTRLGHARLPSFPGLC